MTLFETLHILQKQEYVRVFPRPQQHSDYDFSHPEKLLNAQQLEYCHAIDFITIYLKQRLLTNEDQKNIKGFLLNPNIDSLHRKWLIVLMWHIYYIYDNKNLWFWNWFHSEKAQFLDEYNLLYHSACDDLKYLNLCTTLEIGEFFPAQLLYSEYSSCLGVINPQLRCFNTFATLENANTAWLNYSIPHAAALIITANKAGEFDQTVHPHTHYLLENPKGPHNKLHDWLKKNSCQYRVKTIEEYIEQYLKELNATGIHNKDKEKEITRLCQEHTKIFGDVAGSYYLGIFYYLVAVTVADPKARYESYKISFESFLWVKSHINLTYKHPSIFFNTEETLTNTIIQFANKCMIESGKPMAHYLPNFMAHHPSLSHRILPNGLLLTNFSSEQKETLKVLLLLLKNERIFCGHNMARKILIDNLSRHFLTFEQRIELSAQASLLPGCLMQYHHLQSMPDLIHVQ